MKKSPLLSIFLVVFIDLLGFGIVIPILPYFSKHLGASAFDLGWLMAIYSITQLFFSPIWGGLSDRIGRRSVLLITILGGASAMVGTALAQDYWILFATRFLAGVFAGNISTASAYISDVTKPEDRAKGMGIIGVGFGLGFIFGPAIGGILSPYGYHVPILLAAGLGLGNFLLTFFVLEETVKKNTGDQERRAFSMNGLQLAFSQRSTSVPILLYFVNTLAFVQLVAVFALFVLGKFNYDARNAGWFLAGMGVIAACLQGGLIGKLAKRYGETKLFATGFLFLSVSLVGAALAPVPAIFALFLAGIAIGNGLVVPSLSSSVSKSAPEGRRGSIMGIYQSSSSLARAVGPPIAGLLYDKVGSASPIFGSSILMALALMITFIRWKDLK